MSDAVPAPAPRIGRDAFEPEEPEFQLPPAPKTLAFATWRQPRAFWALALEQAEAPGGAEFRVVKTYEHDLAQIPEGDTLLFRGRDLRAAVQEFDAVFEHLNAPPPPFDPGDEWWDPAEVRTLRRYERSTLDELLARERVQELAAEPASMPPLPASPMDMVPAQAKEGAAAPSPDADHGEGGGGAAIPPPEAARVDVAAESRAVVREVVALIEFERADRDYQEAMGRIGRVESIREAVRESREASERARSEAERVIRARFSHADRLLERVGAMDPAEVRRFASSLRHDPLAASGNESRTSHRPAGVSSARPAAGPPEPRLVPVRARGLGGLVGRIDKEATERQARVAAVALETWADARHWGEQARQWAAGELCLPRATPLGRVAEVAQARAAELREFHREVIELRERLPPAPTRAQIERRLAGMEPGAAESIRRAFCEFLPPEPLQPRPARSPAGPSLSR